MDDLNNKQEIKNDVVVNEELLPEVPQVPEVFVAEVEAVAETKTETETSLTTTSADEEQNLENASKEIDDTSDVFITEKDTFDIRISYYKVRNDFCVESVDDEFDPKNPAVKHVDITFKYPSQGDYETIIAQNAYKTPDKMTLIDVLQMELTRLVVLIRKWSLKAEFNRMIELDTKIVKAIANKVRENIGVKGIL